MSACSPPRQRFERRSWRSEARPVRTKRPAIRARGGETNLVEALKRAMGGRSMSVDEATRKVLEGGYQTTSASFRQIVNITLIRSDQFERVGRGKYRVK